MEKCIYLLLIYIEKCIFAGEIIIEKCICYAVS